jgi:hypothetical protein
MSLWFGHWEVLGVGPTEPAALDENIACRHCGYQPLVTDTQQQQRADQARQLEFGWRT